MIRRRHLVAEIERLRGRIDRLETAELVVTSAHGDLVRVMLADLEALEAVRGRATDDHDQELVGVDLRAIFRLP